MSGYFRRKALASAGFPFLLIGTIFFTACEKPARELALAGRTMGTTYSIKLVYRGPAPDAGVIQRGVDSLLATVNSQMSTWDPNSEISRFNRLTTDELFPISDEFDRVIDQSLAIAKLTDGAFDITVGPLIDLWGFGAGAKRGKTDPPRQEEIVATLDRIGYRKIGIRHQSLVKLNPNIHLDLSAIAKGYGVDAVSDWLAARGFVNYLVEIGGEVYCRGLNLYSAPWQIGIDTPNLDAFPGERLQAIADLSDMGMATSGDYRNYFLYEGKLYSHIIDPRTGYPVETSVASATVVAPRCMDADGYATSLLVLGEHQGLALIESLAGVEALLIIREGENRFRTVKSSGMRVREE
ncbi:MAG: FAD:protein FMN transferase [Candidatus Neomarinimicrobiota bacterium]